MFSNFTTQEDSNVLDFDLANIFGQPRDTIFSLFRCYFRLLNGAHLAKRLPSIKLEGNVSSFFKFYKSFCEC